ncbi:hypothetical protein DPV78_000528 [Talaromyces pinophilus]|nr:hypothetical protein DPV78_000528 [Talaromyces pinophilus]
MAYRMTTLMQFQEPWLQYRDRIKEVHSYNVCSSVMYNNYSEFGIIRVAIQALAWGIIVYLLLSKSIA